MPHITGGGLNGTYNFAQIHMHWGVDSTLGSEHRIKSKRYTCRFKFISYINLDLTFVGSIFHSHPLEFHIVHWNSKYGSFAQASMHAEDGLAVLTVLAEVIF